MYYCSYILGKSFTGKSPFVEMFTLVGLPIAAGLINFVVATSALSSANSGIFATSRMLYGLALTTMHLKALVSCQKKSSNSWTRVFNGVRNSGNLDFIYCSKCHDGIYDYFSAHFNFMYFYIYADCDVIYLLS